MPCPHRRWTRCAALKDFVVENAKSARAFLGAIGMPVRDLHHRRNQGRLRFPLETAARGAPARSALRGRLSGDRRPGRGARRGGAPRRLPGRAARRPLFDHARADGLRARGPALRLLRLSPARLRQSEQGASGSSKHAREREAKPRSSSRRPTASDALLAALLESCHAQTRLCVAADLTLADRKYFHPGRLGVAPKSKSVIGRRPAVFLLLAQPQG